MNTSQGGRDVAASNTLSKHDVEDLLKKGAYGALMEDDNAGDKFCEEDIDLILQKRTTTMTIDNSDQKGGSFSKASFASADTAADISIDDPDFWAKWAKKAEIEEISHEKSLLVSEPRSRKQISRLGQNEMGNISDLETDS